MRKAVIILPTYNEVENVKILIPQIFNLAKSISNWQIEIVVVDSHSPDGTASAVQNLKKIYSRLHLIQTNKLGLGQAYTVGFKTVLEQIKPYVIFEMDADQSHDPNLIPQFLKAIEQGADFVIGSRYTKGGSIPPDWGWHRKLFSIIGNVIVRFGFMQLKITDWTSGYRAIKVWIINAALPHISRYSGYVFQIALLDRVIKMGGRIEEIPLKFTDRKYGKSKIIFGQYIFQIIKYIFQHSSFIKFVVVGFIGFLIDFGLSYIFIEKLKAAVWIATLISTETAIISNFLLNNFWSFAHKKISGGRLRYLIEFIKFNLVSSGSVAIQTIGVQLAVIIFGRQLWYLYKVLIIGLIIIPYSYILYNKFIWREK